MNVRKVKLTNIYIILGIFSITKLKSTKNEVFIIGNQFRSFTGSVRQRDRTATDSLIPVNELHVIMSTTSASLIHDIS